MHSVYSSAPIFVWLLLFSSVPASLFVVTTICIHTFSVFVHIFHFPFLTFKCAAAIVSLLLVSLSLSLFLHILIVESFIALGVAFVLSLKPESFLLIFSFLLCLCFVSHFCLLCSLLAVVACATADIFLLFTSFSLFFSSHTF